MARRDYSISGSDGATYRVVLEAAEEGGFIVQAPAFPEICTQGETEEEALAMAQDAIGLAIGCRQKRNSFVIEAQNGMHQCRAHATDPTRFVIIPLDGPDCFKRKTVEAILKQVQITADQFRAF